MDSPAALRAVCQLSAAAGGSSTLANGYRRMLKGFPLHHWSLWCSSKIQQVDRETYGTFYLNQHFRDPHGGKQFSKLCSILLCIMCLFMFSGVKKSSWEKKEAFWELWTQRRTQGLTTFHLLIVHGKSPHWRYHGYILMAYQDASLIQSKKSIS